jgi:DNA-binding transcriptional MerR regulator
MEKTQEAFRTIGEVAEELDLPQHVLRFWETKFTQIRPVKRAGGRRYYRPDDVQLVAAIRVLLYSEGYTIKGVQRILKEQGARAVIAASQQQGGRGPLALPRPVPAAGGAPESLAQVLVPLLAAKGSSARAQQDLFASASDENPATQTRLSPLDRHRMEAILAELNACAEILQATARAEGQGEARRR